MNMVIKAKRVTLSIDEMNDDYWFEDIVVSYLNEGCHDDNIDPDDILGITQHESQFTVFYDDGDNYDEYKAKKQQKATDQPQQQDTNTPITTPSSSS